MASELKSMRARLVKSFRFSFAAMPVENPAQPGTPDLFTLAGWFELKEIDKWPARPRTIVRVDHFKQHQREWLRDHCQRGGSCYLMLKVGRKEWFIFDGVWAASHLGTVDQETLRDAALFEMTSGYNEEELGQWLRRKVAGHAERLLSLI
jgi:hypothetical protein